MTKNVECFTAEAVQSLVQYVNPAFDRTTCRQVNKWMTPVKDEIARMNNVRMFEMNKTIAACMSCTKMMKGDPFFSAFFSPGF
jgi:hypothetical protein